jgi:transcription termination factor Rho
MAGIAKTRNNQIHTPRITEFLSHSPGSIIPYLHDLRQSMDEIAAMEFLLDKMKNTRSNDEFFSSMKR